MSIKDDLKLGKESPVQLAVEQDGSTVLIAIKCSSEYEAMMLHDKIMHETETYNKITLVFCPT